MKRKVILVNMLLGLLIASCAKKTVNNPVYPDNEGDFTYTVNGFKDTSLERIGSVSMPIFVEKLTGASEKVTFSMFNVPDGMEVLLDKTIEEPSFNTFMQIKTTRTKEGTYPIKVTAASPTTGISEYFFNIKVEPYSNAASGLKGNFIEKGNCSVNGHDVEVVVATDVAKKVIIKGFWQGTMTNEIYVLLNTSNNTLTLPSQKLFGITYQGSGSYSDDQFTLNYTVDGASFSQTCSSTFTRK